MFVHELGRKQGGVEGKRKGFFPLYELWLMEFLEGIPRKVGRNPEEVREWTRELLRIVHSNSKI